MTKMVLLALCDCCGADDDVAEGRTSISALCNTVQAPLEDVRTALAVLSHEGLVFFRPRLGRIKADAYFSFRLPI